MERVYKVLPAELLAIKDGYVISITKWAKSRTKKHNENQNPFQNNYFPFLLHHIKIIKNIKNMMFDSFNSFKFPS